MNSSPVLLLFAGLAVGLLLGWLLAGARASARAGQLATARAAELTTARAELAAARGGDERARAAFAELSEQSLRANAEAVVRMARDQLAAAGAAASGDLARRQAAVEALVSPLRESLSRLESHTGALERARTDAYAALREQLGVVSEAGRGLREETARLVASLRATGVRGRWGELQLRRVVELAGMVEHCDFTTQVGVRGEDGPLRPDMVVSLAGGRRVVVDAKAPFDAFVAASAAQGEDATRYAAHAAAVRGHVRRLAEREYPRAVPGSADFVVLFLPGDGLLAAAAVADPGLVEDALTRRVVLATPTTLVAVLRTVAAVWRENTLVANAAQLRALAAQLYDRLATMGSHLGRLGSSLSASVGAYNATVGSLENRVLVTARRMASLHEEQATLDPPELLDLRPRPLTAAELVDPAEPDGPGRRDAAGRSA